MGGGTGLGEEEGGRRSEVLSKGQTQPFTEYQACARSRNTAMDEPTGPLPSWSS